MEVRYAVLQLAEGKVENERKYFMDYQYLKEHNLQPKQQDYEIAYFGACNSAEEFSLESIYTRFNTGLHPTDYYGHSVSIGDIIVLKDSTVYKAFFCDRVGYRQLGNEFMNMDLQARFDSGVSVGMEYENLKELKEQNLTDGQDDERLKYLQQNYARIVEMAKKRGELFGKQEELNEPDMPIQGRGR